MKVNSRVDHQEIDLDLFTSSSKTLAVSERHKHVQSVPNSSRCTEKVPANMANASFIYIRFI